MAAEHCGHQYKSVTKTLGEEEELPCAMASVFSGADTDLWHIGNNRPLGLVSVLEHTDSALQLTHTSMAAFLSQRRAGPKGG